MPGLNRGLDMQQVEDLYHVGDIYRSYLDILVDILTLEKNALPIKMR